MASSKKKAGARATSVPATGKAKATKTGAAAKGLKATASTPRGPKKATAPKKKAAPKAGARPAARTKAAPPKAAAPRASATRTKTSVPAKPAVKKAAVKAAPVKRPLARKPAGIPARAAAARRRGAAAEDVARRAVAGLSEEDQIRAAKYLPRELPKKLFEEERFLFPESYGVNRVRLLVRDPEWIFAYWDVDAGAMKDLGKSLGERALALSRLTLRGIDPVSGGSSDILLPPGARWWYVRTDSARRTYRAELGVILPSGEFRRLAESNTVVTPRVGPSPERARRRMSYRDARELPPAAAAAAGAAEKQTGVAREPWEAASVDGAAEPGPGGERAERGGASDVFRPGGASDTFRR
jgi:hypothetical protein